MTRNDIRVKFNKEKDLHVLQTEGTGYIHYTDDYVHWLEDIALRQANGAEQGTSNCNIPLVSVPKGTVCPKCKSKYVYYWLNDQTFECDDCNEQWQTAR